MGGFSGGVPDQQIISKLALLLAGNKDARDDQEEMPGASVLSRNPGGMPSATAGATVPGALNAGGGGSTSVPATAAPASSASPAPVVLPTQAPLPTAPTPPTIDAAARQKLATPTDPNVVKPKWYDRLFGGMATFGAAMQHNPNAIELGTDIVNKRYSNAESLRQKQLGAFDANTAAQEKNYQTQRDVFGDQLKAAEEARRQGSASSLSKEHEAKAAKYENAIDPNSIHQGDDGKWYGSTYGDPKTQVEAPAPKGRESLADKLKIWKKEAEEAGLKGDAKDHYSLTGKFREPNPDAEARIAEAKARLEETKQMHGDREFDRQQSQLQQYNKEKADIHQRQGAALEKLEQESRDKKTGAIIDPVTLENRKKEINKQFEAEYNALGAPPSTPGSRGTAARSASPAGNTPASNTPAKPAPAAPKNGGGKQLDATTAKSILAEAGGDKDKARQIAKSRNYKF